MMSSRNNLIFLLCLISTLILVERQSFSETTISEQTLAGDIIIKEMYEPGSGLPVGKIQSVWGQAIVFHRDPTVGYRIQTGLPLYAGDIMHTRATAWILCRLVDGSNIVLTPETTLTILQSSYNSARKAGVSFLYLKHGGARFELNPMPGLTAYDFKVQTETAFTLAREADFIVKANPEATDIIAFEKSRLEVTGMAQPEEITFLSDFQRAIVTQEMISPTVETLSRDDIETVMANFHPAPQSTLLAAGTAPKNNRQDHKIDEKPAE
ncbi:MAG: FecR family protein [Deltaproteobacteria bacterium]|nr:FecR family protein [Deltaproteobacteria bacterium]